MKKTAFMWVALLALLTLAGQVHAQAGPHNTAVVESGEVPELEKAREFYNSGKYEKAIRILKAYVEKRPVPEAYYMIAYSLYKLGRHDEANKYFKQAFLLEPTYSPTPELEKKLNRSLDVARPGAVAPERPMVIPKLLEKRPPVLAEPEEGPSGMAREEPVPAPAPAEPVPAPPEVPAPPAKAPEVVKAAPVPPEAVPPPPETPKAPEAPPAQTEAPAPPEAVPPPPGASQLTNAAPAPPEAPMEAPAEKQLLSKAAEQISKAADELMGEGEKLSREAQRLRERPEVAKLKAQLEQTDPQVLLMGLGILILFYLFFSYCLFRIAKKLRVSKPWLAWFPVLQVWAFIRAADKSFLLSLLLFVIMFVPFLNVIAAVYVWMGITYNTGRNKWLALLILAPVVNILFVVYLAFARILRRASAEKDMLGVSDLTAEPSLPDLDFDLDEGKGPDDSWPDEPLG
jgi:hypothetical protein